MHSKLRKKNKLVVVMNKLLPLVKEPKVKMHIEELSDELKRY